MPCTLSTQVPLPHLEHERLPCSFSKRSPWTNVVVIYPVKAVSRYGPAVRVYVDCGEVQVRYPQIAVEIFSYDPIEIPQ